MLSWWWDVRPNDEFEADKDTLLQTEVLNKHMSIGFTIPFLNLISQSFAGGDQVGLLTTSFGTWSS